VDGRKPELRDDDTGKPDQAWPGEIYCLHDQASNCVALYQCAQAAGLAPHYNTNAANLIGLVQGLCPSGWHMPEAADWDMLLRLVDKEQGAHDEAMSLMYFSPDNDVKWKTNSNPDDLLPENRFGFGVIASGLRVLQADCPVGQGTEAPSATPMPPLPP
jgi:uncharacterized protein (TIGR02145 family)